MPRNKRSRPVHNPPRSKGRVLLFTTVGVVLLCGIAIVAALTLTGDRAQVIRTSSETQTVLLGLRGARYTPDVITVRAGEPVTLANDGSLKGCGLYIMQRDLGIYANFAQSPTYTFTPTKKGTFTYSCSMGMYLGTIEVI